MKYLGYVHGGKTRIGGEQVHNEFIVEAELNAIGVDAWVGRALVAERRGKNRKPDFYERPYLPNYIFMDIPNELYFKAQAVRGLASTFTGICAAEIASLERFKGFVQAEYAEQDRLRRNGQIQTVYKVGQALKSVSPMFEDRLLTFRAIVERAGDIHPKVQASVEMMGREVMVELDPLDVRAAE